MREFFTIIMLVLILALTASAEPLQNCKPGEPGYIDFNKTGFIVGDTVFVFNADAEPSRDKNGYIIPTAFIHADTAVIVGKKLDRYIDDQGATHYGSNYVYEMKILTWKKPVITRCWSSGVPQQRAVFYHF